MKLFKEPELEVSPLEIEDIVTTSRDEDEGEIQPL